jgi:CubicO group peptidase (beta-lactamase class C family)
MGWRRRCACAAGAAVLAGCLFPSLDGLTGPGDATVDGNGGDASDAGGDAGDGGLCPPNSDPTLVGYYPFDEGTGVIAHDCSGHGYDALLNGVNAGNTWTTGHAGSAIWFVPQNQLCVVVGSTAANQSGGDLTVAAWINVVDPINGYIVGQRQQTGFAWRIDVEQTDAGRDLGFAIGTGDDAGDDYTAETFIDLGWHHVAGVFSAAGAMQAVYLDGQKTVSTMPAPAIVPDPLPTTIRIGCRGDDQYYFSGMIDEVRIYSRALSDAEIAALAQN